MNSRPNPSAIIKSGSLARGIFFSRLWFDVYNINHEFSSLCEPFFFFLHELLITNIVTRPILSFLLTERLKE